MAKQIAELKLLLKDLDRDAKQIVCKLIDFRILKSEVRYLKREISALRKKMGQMDIRLQKLINSDPGRLQIENERLLVMAESERRHARKQWEKMIEANRELQMMKDVMGNA